jgi:hypothetical protein
VPEAAEVKIAVGDEVRVHFHPAGPWKSFSEGVVRRVDVTTPEGRFFVLEVKSEVLLDQPHRIRPDFHDYVEYECRNDFPGRIEILSTAEQDVERNHTSDLLSGETLEEPKHKVDKQRSGDVDAPSQPETERVSEPETNSEPTLVDVEPQPVREQGGLLSALLGRRR